ncbi:hypothetical protein [Natronogracilivirga saccharolytica]|uniref:Uncharacterized protein n=1 Tax=Natronogracilivirga saccharolytica TaxID=2812953 RepID=A0A8J7S8R8_9BACT|nr:hypothetical protein [Natronogracilivirga saccharolytica]MBP3192326.1 hypothetical protein [Natronogracilivirga saccharolytica]
MVRSPTGSIPDGLYWSSAVPSGSDTWIMDFDSGYAGISVTYRADGPSLCCIKDE